MGDRWVIGEYKLKRCPIKEMTSSGLEYLQAYRFYKYGRLPCPGGWMDQTKTFVDAINVIESAVTDVEKDAQKKKH